MNKKFGLPVFLIAVVAAAALGFGAAWALGYARYDASDRLLAEAKEKIETQFVGTYDGKAVEDGAISGMVGALNDRWSYYLNAEDYKAHVDAVNNSYVGIGITVEQNQEGDGLIITKVQPSSPAAKSGLKAGDCITGADGTAFQGSHLSKIKKMIMGKEGSGVTLTVRRANGKIQQMTLVREEVTVIPVTARMLDGQTGYVKISNFDKTAGDHLIQAADALRQQGARRLVFDVRNNPGGMLTELLKTLDYLLPQGPTFVSKDYTGKETTYTSDKSCVNLPIAVLVNGDSYSAAEFFAAALQESGHGIVVGTKTCGKGYSQTPVMLSDGSAVMLSTAAYYTANHRSLIGTGVTPNVAIALSKEDNALLLAEKLPDASDSQLQRAIAALEKE
ncbi:MAG: S41 family peptidase [Oscillospiraceae bacterium]|nr:S41 family peptidase [Oscillospiraceae bacterium]